jgi:hypothetical protein
MQNNTPSHNHCCCAVMPCHVSSWFLKCSETALLWADKDMLLAAHDNGGVYPWHIRWKRRRWMAWTDPWLVKHPKDQERIGDMYGRPGVFGQKAFEMSRETFMSLHANFHPSLEEQFRNGTCGCQGPPNWRISMKIRLSTAPRLFVWAAVYDIVLTRDTSLLFKTINKVMDS